MNDIGDTLREVIEDGVILCVRLGEGAAVIDATRAAIRGGLRLIEMTLTTPGALDAIHRLATDGEGLVGAGTVLSTDDVGRVADSGGRFVLSPVFDSDVVDAARERGLLAIPGASTPKEILTAHRHGAKLVKVFPAGALGGPPYLRAIRGPLPDVPLLPTNGPTAETIKDYFDAGATAVGVGGEVFPPGFTMESIDAAARRVRQAVDTARPA